MRFPYLIYNWTLFLFVRLLSPILLYLNLDSALERKRSTFCPSSPHYPLLFLLSLLTFFFHLIFPLILPYFLSLFTYSWENYVLLVILNLACLASKDRYTPEIKGSFHSEFRNWVWWAFRHWNFGATMRVDLIMEPNLDPFDWLSVGPGPDISIRTEQPHSCSWKLTVLGHSIVWLQKQQWKLLEIGIYIYIYIREGTTSILT